MKVIFGTTNQRKIEDLEFIIEKFNLIPKEELVETYRYKALEKALKKL